MMRPKMRHSRREDKPEVNCQIQPAEALYFSAVAAEAPGIWNERNPVTF